MFFSVFGTTAIADGCENKGGESREMSRPCSTMHHCHLMMMMMVVVVMMMNNYE